MFAADLPVTVVLVNYNTRAVILDCLAALACQSLSHRTIVVDNDSSDGSLRAIAAHHPDVTLVPLRRNVGFARAANIGALRAGNDGALVLLNPDTVPEPFFLEALTAPLSVDPRIGSVAGTLVFESNPNVVASAGIEVHQNGVALDAGLGASRSTFSSVQPVFGASGGAAAYRAAAFHDTGGFCEPFFLYLEDVDLAWRLRLRGWDAVATGDAIATHAYSASSIEGSPFKRRLLARNRLWVLARCLPSPLWTRDRRSILGFDSAAVGFAAVTGDIASLAGRVHGIAGLPARLAERTRIQSAASIHWTALDRWIQPAVSPTRLRELRRLTRDLAAQPGDSQI